MAQKPNQKKKSHKTLWIVLAIVAVVVIAVVAWGIHTLNNMGKAMTEAMSGNTAEVEKGFIQVVTEGTGMIETVDTITQNVEYTVKLNSLYKENGEAVKAGEVIGEFSGTALDESITALETQLETIEQQLKNSSKEGETTAEAPAAGRVKRIWAAEGDSVKQVMQAHPGLAEISADGKLKVEFDTEAELAVGQKVTVVYGEEQIEAEIQSVKGTRAAAAFPDGEAYGLDADVAVKNGETQIGTGKTQSSCPIYVTGESGTVKSISVEENAKVSAGAAICKLTDTDYSAGYLALLEQHQQLSGKLELAREYRQGFVLTAPFDGIITELTAKEGDTLPAGTAFCRFLDTSAYEASIAIDELDIQDITEGQKAEITVDAAEGVAYQGTVSDIALAGNNENGVAGYQVSIRLENGEKLLPGMTANAKITVGDKEDALLVPIDAIQTVDGKKVVNVIQKGKTAQQREVTLGLVNNENAEILEGLEAGEKVQIVIKLSDIYSQMGISMEGSTEEEATVD